jgi:hypothetical protein
MRRVDGARGVHEEEIVGTLRDGSNAGKDVADPPTTPVLALEEQMDTPRVVACYALTTDLKC